ncbi:MAG: tetraacyldisaccharide 4'-kinase [Pirellulales bacterium]|nr:tetraacyldisaccharide 4'-kinase [Pirellulales bacterium]
MLETPYALEVSRRNRRFDRGAAKIHRVSVPVVSVGNLTLGGTGKTPLVEWIARWFRKRGVRVSIVSRGYGAEAGSRNDEARELERKLPDVPHVQDADRAAAARIAIEELETQLIVLDDGFQHRRLGRDLDIVLLDALEPFGFEHVFPRGTLREPLAGLRRADAAILSRADMLDPVEREKIRRRVERIAPKAAWAEIRHAPVELLSAGGQAKHLDELRGCKVAAFCGVGNPAGFRHTLATCGYEVAGFRDFPDHHHYTREDIETLSVWARSLDAEATVCTHKDLVKIGLENLGGGPLWVLRVEMEFLAGGEAIERMLRVLGDRATGGPNCVS